VTSSTHRARILPLAVAALLLALATASWWQWGPRIFLAGLGGMLC
jgi:hypothetical protein